MSALKDLVKTVSEAINTGAHSLEDGFQVTDLFALIPIASQVPGILATKGAIGEEWKARTSDTLKDILTELQVDLSLTDKKLEAKIEKGVALALAAADLFAEFKSEPATDQPA